MAVIKIVESAADLIEFGITPLSNGECAARYRVTCELTETGIEIIRLLMGSAAIAPTPAMRNLSPSPTGGDNLVCITIGPEMVKDVAVVAMLFMFDYPKVIVAGRSEDGYFCIVGLQSKDDENDAGEHLHRKRAITVREVLSPRGRKLFC